MGTITAQKILDRTRRALNDEDSSRWPEVELLEHLSDAQRAIVMVRPEAGAVTAQFTCVAGSRQDLQAHVPMLNAWTLIDVIRNISSTTRMPIVREDRSNVERFNPKWYDEGSAGLANDARVYTFDPRNRKYFYLFPAVANGRIIEIVYARIPAEITDDTETIEIDDTWQPALLSYVLHRAFAKDAPVAGQSAERAAGYYQQFLTYVGAREAADARTQPGTLEILAERTMGR